MILHEHEVVEIGLALRAGRSPLVIASAKIGCALATERGCGLVSSRDEASCQLPRRPRSHSHYARPYSFAAKVCAVLKCGD